MPELMTKQDAIEYLLYMKHDVQAKSPMDIALDTAIEALKQPTIEPEVRRGEWKKIVDGWAKCSECGDMISSDFATFTANFCPNCGARMDGGADNG